MKRRSLLLAWLAFTATAYAASAPAERYCEWKGDAGTCADICPEFFWAMPGQVAYQVLVATAGDKLQPDGANVWDSGKVETALPIAELDGKPLVDGATYWWTFRIWTADGPTDWAEPWSFALRIRRLPQMRSHTRTFVFYSAQMPEVAERFDILFTPKAKKLNPQCTRLRYGLLATMVLPSKKADDLARFCVERGLTEEGILEDMFIHFAEDTSKTLHARRESTRAPRIKRLVPGWDPRNDRNGDGTVDDAEFAQLVDPKATARRKCFARVPMYFWGPPRDDYVMYVGHRDYQRFLAEVYAKELVGGTDGLFIDTTPPTIPGAGGRPVLEYPDRRNNPGAWLRDMQIMLARVKLGIGDKLLTANGWRAKPFVIDGMSAEGWLRINSGVDTVEATFDRNTDLDRRGKIQMLQYNPIYAPEISEFGPKIPVSLERDAYFGLALFYLNQGPYMFHGNGRHPYGKEWQLYVPATDFDIGKPLGPYRVLNKEEDKPLPGTNLLKNSGFEVDADNDGVPDHWQAGHGHGGPKYISRVTDEKHSGNACAFQEKKTPDYFFAQQYVTLKPHTTYTFCGWVRTEGVTIGSGAQIYAYEFDGAVGTGVQTFATGTTPWRRYAASFTTGDDPVGRINFRIYANGKAWFDDLQLVAGAFGTSRLMARDYEKALVLAKVGTVYHKAETHKLPGTFRLLRRDKTLGPPVSEISLRQGEAAIMTRQ